MQHSHAHFFVGFQKDFKVKTNILRYLKYIRQTRIPEAWLQMFKNSGIGTFKLTHFYEYKYRANLTNIKMNLDYFFVLQQEPYEWDYFLQGLELKDT